MAGRLAKLTAAPIVEAYKGQRLTWAPLTLQQTARFKDIIRQRAVVEYEAGKATLAAGHAPAKHVEMLDTEFAFTARYPLESHLAQTDDHILAEWMLLSLEDRHPGFTLDDAWAMIADAKERIQALKAAHDAAESAAKNASRAGAPAATTARTPRHSGSKPSAASAKPTAGPRRRSPR